MLDRSVAPEFKAIKKLSLVHPEEQLYPNGLKSFIFKSADLDLIRIEFIFSNIYEKGKLPLLNSVLSAMFKEGTTSLSSSQIAEKIDFYGAYLMPEFSFDHTSLTLYTMRKYVGEVLPIVSSVLKDSIFPQQELETHICNSKQNLQISLQKNDVLARRKLYQTLFGDSRYANLSTEELYDQITREELLSLYKKQIQPNNCTLMIVGNVDQSILNTIESYFASSWESTDIMIDEQHVVLPEVSAQLIIENRDEALQSAIRLGEHCINRQHKDYPALQFVNTLFGGFFGSRLMRNIREDKGYTYSIGSAVGNLKYAGFFTVVSEVGVDVTKDTLKEIEKEFEILRQEKTAVEDIDLVRNYMQGVMLGTLESIFSHVDKFKSAYFSGLDLSYFDYYADVIQDINAEKVQDIAIQYFDYDRLVKVVVGKLD